MGSKQCISGVSSAPLKRWGAVRLCDGNVLWAECLRVRPGVAPRQAASRRKAEDLPGAGAGGTPSLRSRRWPEGAESPAAPGGEVPNSASERLSRGKAVGSARLGQPLPGTCFLPQESFVPPDPHPSRAEADRCWETNTFWYFYVYLFVVRISTSLFLHICTEQR